MFTIERSKGKNKVQKIILPWTVSFKFPYAGGLMDQPHRLMIFFGEFMSGDRAAANKRLNSTN